MGMMENGHCVNYAYFPKGSCPTRLTPRVNRTLFRQITQEYGEKAMSRSTFQNKKGGADPVKYQRIVARVGPQLSVILNLSVAIRGAVIENVAGKVSFGFEASF